MNLEQKIADYQPSELAKELLRSTKITLLAGIAGAGKDTIRKRLLMSEDFSDIVTSTTRSPRVENGIRERNGIDYHFIDIPTVEAKLDQHAFIEVKFVHGAVYGSTTAAFEEIQHEGKIALTDVDVQGVDEYKRLADETVAIFILPPDYATWRARLEKRYASSAEFAAEWPKRRRSAIKELTHALEVPYYHFIINDTLDEAVRVASEIAHKPDVFHRKDDEARLAARDLLDSISQVQ